MDDLESKNTLMTEEIEPSAPLSLCNLVFRLKPDKKLNMQDVTKCAGAITLIELVIAIAVRYMRPNAFWLPVLALLPICMLYNIMFLNVTTGPWGSENSRFWCDVKIMYVRGYNTIRTITRMFSTSILFVFMNHLLGHTQILVTLLLILIIVVIEWQSGLAENAHQYDIKVFDRFMDGNCLCLESLHFYQLQKKSQTSHWMSFAIACFVKIYTVTCIFITASGHQESPFFQVPIIINITVYSIILPALLDFAYLKSAATFCQVEMVRTVADVFFPFIVIIFSLV